MKAIKTNLATRVVEPWQVPSYVTVVIVIVAVLFSLSSAVDFAASIKRIESAEQRIVALNPTASLGSSQGVGLKSLSKSELRELRAEAAYVNTIITENSFSWISLLSAIEETLPNNVSIVRVSPNFSTGKVSISALSKSKKDALMFVDSMAKSSDFSEVFLLSHSKNKDKKRYGFSSEKIIFNLTALYNKGDA
jgi:hypothetical protein